MREVEIPQNKLLGAVFCHGHKHMAIPRDFQHDDTFWIYIDINEDSAPDIVADVTNDNLIDLLGPQSLSYIIFMFCPIVHKTESKDFYENNILHVASDLLVPGGVLYWVAGVSSLLKNSVSQLAKKGLIKLYDARINIRDLMNEQFDHVQNKYEFDSYNIMGHLPNSYHNVLCLTK